jgi:hypothetical protein
MKHQTYLVLESIDKQLVYLREEITRLEIDLEEITADRDEWRTASGEHKKAAEMNCKRYLKLESVLKEIKAAHDTTDWAGCESVKYLQSCAYSDVIAKITAALGCALAAAVPPGEGE